MYKQRKSHLNPDDTKDYLKRLNIKMEKAAIYKDVEEELQDEDEVSHSGLTPVRSEYSVESQPNDEESEDAGEYHPENYKDDAYWSLPENVRHAIDLIKVKKQHSEFY